MQNWLVIRTRSRWEKKVSRSLLQQGIETFCPLMKVKHQWSDRIKTIETPLLKATVFVRITEEQRTAVRLTEGVLNFVYSNGKPVAVKEKLVQQIRQFQDLHPSVAVVENNNVSENAVDFSPVQTPKAKETALWIDTLNVKLVASSGQAQHIEAPIAKI